MTRSVSAAPASFAAVSPRKDATKDSLEYAKDVSKVFVGVSTWPYPLKDCDPATFAVITPDGKYARDRTHVYYYGIPLKHADPETFQVLQPPYSRDLTHVFAGPVSIDVEDASTFEVVVRGSAPIPSRRELDEGLVGGKSSGWGWGRDSVAYYCADLKVAGVDRDSFEFLNLFHAKDKNHVYYVRRRDGSGRVRVSSISGADPATFELIGPGSLRGRDASNEFLRGHPLIRIERND